MSAAEWINYIILASMLGVAGQLIRVAIGLKKLHDKNSSEGKKTPFDSKKFWISIVLGGLAGLLTSIGAWDPSRETLDREFLASLMAAGYAGSDIIEGMIEKWTKPNMPTSQSAG